MSQPISFIYSNLLVHLQRHGRRLHGQSLELRAAEVRLRPRQVGVALEGGAGGEIAGEEDYEKYQSYSLNPRTTSGSAMGLYSDKYGYEYENFHIMVSVMNASEDPIPYLDGTIDYLSIPSITRLEVLPEITLPGGLTLNSTEDDFRAVYGEPSSEYNDESTEFRSLTFKDGDVDLKISWYKGRINEITLTI